jgi:hypothetical protein
VVQEKGSTSGRRIRTDYRMDDTGVEIRSEAGSACHEAAAAIVIFEALSNDPKSKDTAVTAMKHYARNTRILRVI